MTTQRLPYDNGDSPTPAFRAAEYVRMSTEHQQYSTENQADRIREYAQRRGIQIVKTYADEGKSGLRIDGRHALQQLIADVESGKAEFNLILVYDVSRWGRFQDADESAYYEYICKRKNILVSYVAEQFENDGSPVSTTDRLVGAANMFDIMPASACEADEELPPALKDAKLAARDVFRVLPSSPERDSVLNALGRIGKPSLKRKIRSRVKLIIDAVGAKFPNLELVTDQAVDCRNYYVHGTPGKFSYEGHPDQPIFFTDTLEFVFAASDLIDSGWDIAEWIKHGTTMSHPFGRYCVDYAARLLELKKILA